jgi:hypothetical protein
MGLWRGLATDHVAVVTELANEVVGLLQHVLLVARPIREACDDPVVGDVDLERNAAALVDGSEAALLHQGQHAEDLASAILVSLLLDSLAQRTHVLAGDVVSPQQLLDLRRCPRTAVLGIDAEEAVLVRRCSRSSWPVCGSITRTHRVSQRTCTSRPIHPGGTA